MNMKLRPGSSGAVMKCCCEFDDFEVDDDLVEDLLLSRPWPWLLIDNQ